MDDEIDAQLKTALENLPAELRQFVASGEWRTKLNPLLGKYSLAGEPTQKAADEVLLTLVGITDPDDLALSFQTTAGLNQEQAEALANEVENEVLTPFNQHLAALNPVSVETDRAEDLFRQLPAAVREEAEALDIGNIVRQIGEEQHLHIDQMGELDETVMETLSGVLPPQKVAETIGRRLAVTQETAGELTLELNRQVFQPIRERLKQTTAVEEPPSREEILAELENPPETVLEQKLTRTFQLPKEEAKPPAPETEKDPYIEPPE